MDFVDFIELLLGIFFYLLPAFIAGWRHHWRAVPIFWVNFLLGWTIIGWFVALFWSFGRPTPPVYLVRNVDE